MSNQKTIPALTDSIKDLGTKYMVGGQRRVMLDWLGIPLKDQPRTANEQNQLLMMAKAENFAGYNKAFDIVIRKIAGEGSTSLEKAYSLMTDFVDEKIANAEHEAILELANTMNNKISYESESILRRVTKQADEAIQAAVEKVIVVEHEYNLKKVGCKTKKLKGPLPEEFQDILDLADERVNVMLVGPSGCGKTHISAVVAEALGLEFASQSCSAGMSESIFSGWLLPVTAGGAFSYVQSEFVRLYENGGVFLFDEVDASDSNTMLFLNQALANESFYLAQRHENPKVVKHKDFVAIAAANTWGNGASATYNGRNALDGASLDRFRMGVIEMDYSPVVEESIIDAQVLKFGREVRHLIESHGIRKIMSTRFLIDATKMKRSKGWSLLRISKSYFSDWSPEEKRICSSLVRKLEMFEGAE